MDRVELDDSGKIALPGEIVSRMKPHMQFEVEFDGSAVRLVPVLETAQQITRSTKEAEEWVKSFLDWVRAPKPPVPILPDEAFRRESIYD